MNLNEILNFCNYICAKEQSGKTFTPLQYNVVLPVINLQLFKNKYAEFETAQKFTDALMPFKVWMGEAGTSPLILDANGYAEIPSDYKHYSSLSFKKVTNQANCSPKIDIRTIAVLNDQEFDYYRQSTLKRPNFKYPVCNFQNGYIRFLPINLQYVDFVYLRTPATPYYAYTIDPVTDEYVYNDSASTQLEWRDEEQLEVINLLLETIGINLREEQLQVYANNRKIEDKINDKA